MIRLLPASLILTTSLILGLVTPSASQQSPSTRPLKASVVAVPKVHRIAIQVSQNDPAVMRMALNNIENLNAYYREKGERVEVELVAFGPGLHMLRDDTSPVRDRLRSLVEKKTPIIFSGCGNTLSSQSKQEEKQLSLVAEARIIPSGIVRIAELQEQGWSYVRP